MIGYSAFVVATAWWLRALLGVVATGVTLHLLHLRTLTKDMVGQFDTVRGKSGAQQMSRTDVRGI